ncbi:MAG: H-NS histone family protein [Proteobacteria bacterium]|nr:H-NS histone family protein [Pseudomonadota bacterium]
MNFDELLAIKAKVEAAIDARIGEERRRLEASLKRLDKISASVKADGRTPKPRNGVTKRTLAPKYRNPANPKETWAGRGNRPRWLVAALKGGKKKLADFTVARHQ